MNTQVQLPAHLLVPYLTAAAREILSGEGLSTRSEQAVDEAIEQLLAEQAALEGDAVPIAGTSVSNLRTPTSTTLHLATVVVGSLDSDQQHGQMTPNEELNSVRSLLTTAIELLQGLPRGDKASATRIVEILGRAISGSSAGPIRDIA